MASLATLPDVIRFGFTLTEGQEEFLLARASARIRRAAGQQISRTTSTVRLPVDGGAVTLPGPPIAAVSAVTKLTEDGGTTLTGWRWDGHDRLTCIPWYRDIYVTYTHGLAVMPDELVELVCAVAARLDAAPSSGGMEAGIRATSLGDYSVTYAADALDTASGLLPGEEAQLRTFLGELPSACTIRLR